MPKRSALETEVPKPLLDEVNAKLVAGGFSNYRALSAWLNERLAAEGLEVRISKTALHNHGQEFQAQFEAEMAETRQLYQIAKISVGDSEDTEGVVREATIRTLQTRLLKLAVALRQAEEAGDDVHLLAETSTKIARAVADLGRADIASQKWKDEVRKQANQAADAAAKIAAKGGLSEASVEEIRRKILGIAA